MARTGKGRAPDPSAIPAWAAAGLLEIHAMFPVLAETRLVPVVLFPSLGLLLPPPTAVVGGIAAVSWLLSPDGGGAPTAPWTASILGIAVIGTTAGMTARLRLARSNAGKDPVQEAIRESRALVLPWEAPSDGDRADTAETVDGLGLLRSREEHREGVRRILEGLLPATGADRILYVLSSNDPGKTFRVDTMASRRGEGGGGGTIPGSFEPLREATFFRRTFFSDGAGGERWTLSLEGRTERPTGIASSPVIVEGNVEGALLALRNADGPWNEPVGPALEMGAFFIARELRAERQRYLVARYLARVEGFHRLVRKIAEVSENRDDKGGVSPRREVYRAAADQIRRHLDVRQVLLVEIDGEGKNGRIAWESSEDRTGEREEWITLEGTYVEWVQRNGVHRIVRSAASSPARSEVLPASWNDRGCGSFLLVPVAGAGGFRGVLVCAAEAERGFDGRNAEAVAEILSIMRMGISHAQRLETLERQAETDGLTGLLNRKTFQARLTNVLSRLDGRYPCAVIMMDIDRFKKINDTYGHPAGDEVIRKVSAVIVKTIRKVDMAARYGGEEFVVYLHMADRSHAMHVAERIRLSIRQTWFVFGGKNLEVTISLGIACYPAHGTDCGTLLGRADEALYRSKENGRDKVTLYLER